jgi:poly(3-hydroxyalkanoate) synthetase
MRIEDTYNNNNDDEDGNGKIVNLKNITMPFLNVAQKDDLVGPASSKALNDALRACRFDDRKNAHKELWPKLGEWIKNHPS